MPIEMKLPELGENIEGGDVLRVIVKAGETIKKDQPVLELETDKATIEVPSSAEGVVKDVKVKAGEKVKVGQTIFVVEDGAGAAKPETAKPETAKPQAEKPQAAKPEAAKPQAPAGGPAPSAPGRPVAVPSAAAAPAAPSPSPAAAPQPERRPAQVVEMSRPKPAQPDAASIPAAPAARRLARELGVSIEDVPGSGAAGRISMDDVTAYARRLLQAGAGRAPAAATLPDFAAWGPVERKPMSGVRRTTAHRLTQAWNTVPAVVQHDRADITSLDALRKRLSRNAEAAGRAPVTVTAFLIKTIAAALQRFPQVNASADLGSDEIIYKHYIHIGVAVDTDRGLLVPVIRDADRKDLFQLADEIAAAAEKARNRKLSLDDMQGASFTISNLGGLGGGPFSPIVNWPEAAILGVARARMEPLWIDGQFVPRLMLPLSLSYDHRLVDGADGVRFLRWVVEALEQPALAFIPEL